MARARSQNNGKVDKLDEELKKVQQSFAPSESDSLVS